MQQIISSSTMRMTSIEIADMVNCRHDSVKRTIERLATPKDDGTPAVIQLPPMVEVENNQSLSPNSRSKAYVFQGEKGKRDSIIVVAQLSPQFTARLVDRWQELESKEASRQPVSQLASPIETDLRAIGVVADILRASESSKLGMVRTYCEQHAPRILPVLPAYAIDKPSDSTTDSSKDTVPISVIVDGITSAKKANLALHAAGLLEKRFREKSDGTIKSFWTVTEEGEKYGKNFISPNNPRETQPHWYACKSDEIVKIVTDNLG